MLSLDHYTIKEFFGLYNNISNISSNEEYQSWLAAGSTNILSLNSMVVSFL